MAKVYYSVDDYAIGEELDFGNISDDHSVRYLRDIVKNHDKYAIIEWEYRSYFSCFFPNDFILMTLWDYSYEAIVQRILKNSKRSQKTAEKLAKQWYREKPYSIIIMDMDDSTYTTAFTTKEEAEVCFKEFTEVPIPEFFDGRLWH